MVNMDLLRPRNLVVVVVMILGAMFLFSKAKSALDGAATSTGG